ncbi:alpha/beta fold hydrolase [Streptomyces prasinopilosus]|uniref:Pimeloyl-ACP methyl ester carboxylesterase n=1 Tax=Streptomyces prasinopilosus TaxID=67344 RepID=A0A1G6IL89_9ACTN|nr:alpha/beta hydrolase [Streptomyces prasinopilosus]SDC07234.1 Pimeloyl-ACP methyl ester carboxylesterase [Streptomyces prasinopilosus]
MRTALTAPQGSPNTQRHGFAPPPPEQVVEERTLVFEGFAYECRIVHQDTPRTAPLLLLGGSSQNRHSWQGHEKWLAPLCTVITVDLPGYGSADFLPARYGIDFLAAAVQHVLVETGMPPVNLFGGCFGEVVGLRFAQLHPGSVRRIVFCGAAMRLPEIYTDAMPRLARALERGETEAAAGGLVELFMSNPAAGQVRRHAAVARLLHRQFMNQTPDELGKAVEHNTRLVTHGCYEPLPVPDVPTLVFTGEHDTLCTPQMGRELAATIPAARFTTVKEADHLVTVERRQESSELIGRFCTDRPIDDLPYCTPVESPGAGLARATAHR